MDPSMYSDGLFWTSLIKKTERVGWVGHEKRDYESLPIHLQCIGMKHIVRLTRRHSVHPAKCLHNCHEHDWHATLAHGSFSIEWSERLSHSAKGTCSNVDAATLLAKAGMHRISDEYLQSTTVGRVGTSNFLPLDPVDTTNCIWFTRTQTSFEKLNKKEENQRLCLLDSRKRGTRVCQAHGFEEHAHTHANACVHVKPIPPTTPLQHLYRSSDGQMQSSIKRESHISMELHVEVNPNKHCVKWQSDSTHNWHEYDWHDVFRSNDGNGKSKKKARVKWWSTANR